MRRRLVALTALAGLAAAPAAASYVFDGVLWPNGTIRYYNAAPDHAWAVGEAVRAWNTSGARIRFVATTAERAQLVIRTHPHGRCVAHANATVGYVRRSTVLLPRLDTASSICNHYSSAHAVAHELGHVLGLRHESRGCATMNPTGTWRGPGQCPRGHPWTWRCGLVEHDDVRGVVRFYGGSVRVPPAGARVCNAYGAIAPPTALVAAYRAEHHVVTLSFTRPADAQLPTFLARSVAPTGAYALARAANACPADHRNASRYRWDVRVGGRMEIHDRPGTTGRYCYSIWAVDALGRPSDTPARAWVVVTG